MPASQQVGETCLRCGDEILKASPKPARPEQSLDLLSRERNHPSRGGLGPEIEGH
jgi:hypothetical protein